MTVLERLETSVEETAIPALLDKVTSQCGATRKQICGIDPMSVEKQIKVTSFIYDETGCLLDYGEAKVEEMDQEAIATALAEFYDNREPKKRGPRVRSNRY